MLKGYRTVIFNVTMALFTVLLATGVITPEQSPGADTLNTFLDHLDAVLIVVTTGVNVFLRFITNTPIGQKEAAQS